MIVLITGTSSGIGKAIAEYFLERGHEVHGFDVRESSITVADDAREGTGSVAGEAQEGRYYHYLVDVTEPESFPEDLEPEILINNAGVQNSGRDIEINLKGTINITERYAIGNEKIKAVVNIGSASAHTGSEFPEYAASKGGLISYTKNVALRLAPYATCNSIDPGGVMTELNSIVMNDPALWDQIMALTPLKRWAIPEEIAEWVYFVAVNNKFMTGQNLLIDGGEAGYNHFVWPED